MRDGSSSPVLRVVAGFALLALGVAIGFTLGGSTAPARAAEPGSASAAGDAEALGELRELVEALARDVRALRELERPAPASAPAPAPIQPATTPSREPMGGPPPALLDEILARFDRLEQTQRELLAVERSAPAYFTPAVPAGVPVRDYLKALKECGQSDEVKRAHLLWDMQRVRDVYGLPDDVQDRGDYIEWIYKLPQEGTQFDFHFTGGLVVEAH